MKKLEETWDDCYCKRLEFSEEARLRAAIDDVAKAVWMRCGRARSSDGGPDPVVSEQGAALGPVRLC